MKSQSPPRHGLKRLNPAIVLLGTLVFSAFSAQAERKIVFYDDEDILYKSGIRRFIKRLAMRDPVITPEGWEVGSKISLCSVSFSGTRIPRYMMWYQVDSSARGLSAKEYNNVVAFATSQNGSDWDKPNIAADDDVTPKPHFPGFTTNSNIVLTGIGATIGNRNGCSVIYDDTGTVSPDRRYKMVYVDWKDDTDPSQGVGLQVAFSPDGKDWDKYPSNTTPNVLKKIAFNQAGNQPPKVGYSTWVSPSLWRIPRSLTNVVNVLVEPAKVVNGVSIPKTYVLYGRMDYDGPDGSLGWKGGLGRCTSTDFLTWTDPELVLTPGDFDATTASFQDAPVLLSAGHYLSLCQITGTAAGTNDIQLLSSRDGKRWNRFRPSEYENVSIMPRNTDPAEFDSRSLYTNASIVEGDSMRFYYGGHSVTGNTTAIASADIKRDRLVGLKAVWSNTTGTEKSTTVAGTEVTLTSVRATSEYAMMETRTYTDTTPPAPETEHSNFPEPEVRAPSGQVTLKEIDFDPYDTLQINAVIGVTTGTLGAIRVDVLTPQGFPVDTFTSGTCVPVGSAYEIRWPGDRTLADLPASPLNNLQGTRKYLLRFYLRDSELYGCTLLP